VHRERNISRRNREGGVVILLVAIVLLFVVGAMAALSIDTVTFYTARSEAQLAADGAALAGARVLANSGMTSNPSDAGLVSSAETVATSVAKKVATNNKVGGRNLDPATEVTVTFPVEGSNPRVRVQVTRTDLPTFFARIWGRTQVTVAASATAEAYNPSGLNAALGDAPPIKVACVKPWVLPNMDPRNGNPIFNPVTGAIQDSSLLGVALTTVPLVARCEGTCSPSPPSPPPSPWQFYAGDQSSFPAPTQSLPTCNVALDDYQTSIAGCVQTPISCNDPLIRLDLNPDSNRNTHTAHAVNCLTHTLADKGDTIDSASGNPPFQFIGGLDNPVAGAQGANILVSDSLVTVPVYDSSAPLNTSVQVIGFVQLFLNPDGTKTSPGSGKIDTRVVNLVGCGTNATGQAVLGNGASAIPVRLITQ
jgi:Flp pilus assembly protein TadG